MNRYAVKVIIREDRGSVSSNISRLFFLRFQCSSISGITALEPPPAPPLQGEGKKSLRQPY